MFCVGYVGAIRIRIFPEKIRIFGNPPQNRGMSVYDYGEKRTVVPADVEFAQPPEVSCDGDEGAFGDAADARQTQRREVGTAARQPGDGGDRRRRAPHVDGGEAGTCGGDSVEADGRQFVTPRHRQLP